MGLGLGGFEPKDFEPGLDKKAKEFAKNLSENNEYEAVQKRIDLESLTNLVQGFFGQHLGRPLTIDH